MTLKQYIESALIKVKFNDDSDSTGKLVEVNKIIEEYNFLEEDFGDSEDKEWNDCELRSKTERNELDEYKLKEIGVSIREPSSESEAYIDSDGYEAYELQFVSRWEENDFNWLREEINKPKYNNYDPSLLFIATYYKENEFTYHDMVEYVSSFIPCSNWHLLYIWVIDPDNPSKARACLTRALSWCYGEKTKVILLKLLDDDDDLIREIALEVLDTWYPVPSVLKKLINLIQKEESEFIAYKALCILRDLRNDGNRQYIETSIKNTKWFSLYDEQVLR